MSAWWFILIILAIAFKCWMLYRFNKKHIEYVDQELKVGDNVGFSNLGKDRFGNVLSITETEVELVVKVPKMSVYAKNEKNNI